MQLLETQPFTHLIVASTCGMGEALPYRGPGMEAVWPGLAQLSTGTPQGYNRSATNTRWRTYKDSCTGMLHLALHYQEKLQTPSTSFGGEKRYELLHRVKKNKLDQHRAQERREMQKASWRCTTRCHLCSKQTSPRYWRLLTRAYGYVQVLSELGQCHPKSQTASGGWEQDWQWEETVPLSWIILLIINALFPQCSATVVNSRWWRCGCSLHYSLSSSVFWNVFLASQTTYRKLLEDTESPQHLGTQSGLCFPTADALHV